MTPWMWKSFRHGIHPPEHKDETRGLAIRQFPFAPEMVIALQQHTGRPAIAEVKRGQEVIRGQRIARPDGRMSVAMHAPVSGTVSDIGWVPHIGGKLVPGIRIQTYSGSTQEVMEGQPVHWGDDREAILNAIQQAGIVGLGGAAFPTHVKLSIPDNKTIDTVIVNGVECEPYLTTDHRVMLEQTEDIFTGLRYVLQVTAAKRAVIAVEANKQDAADKLAAHMPTDIAVSVAVLQVKYPQGAEKMLIHSLLGRRVPSGGLPLDVGAVVINVATTAEIGRLLPLGRGIQERVVTISGDAIGKKGNYRIPIGTPLRFALQQVDVSPHCKEVFIGGPMMGQSVSNLDVGITKGSSGFVALTRSTADRPEYPCIHCGRCVEACPMMLNPSQLGLMAKKQDYETMARDWHLNDCFECGACSYVCPSNIPLVQYFRLAKHYLRKNQAA